MINQIKKNCLQNFDLEMSNQFDWNDWNNGTLEEINLDGRSR